MSHSIGPSSHDDSVRRAAEEARRRAEEARRREEARRAAEAARAARNNLDLVTDSYSRGVVSIIDLLDAQNASLIADEAASNAVYDFLIDFIEVERAVGRFYFLAGPEERQQLFDRADAFYRELGATLPRRNE